MPVIIRRMPSTPKAGSSLVARTTGSDVGVAEADGDGVDVGVTVYVTLNTVGMTVVKGTSWLPEWVAVVTVTDPVVRDSDTL
jgi:hypothetical protein